MLNMKSRRVPKEWEHRSLHLYWAGRLWNHPDGSPVLSDSGLPRDVEDLAKLSSVTAHVEKKLRAAFLTLGATEFRMTPPNNPGSVRRCMRCSEFFEPKRCTARFCLDCRTAYSRRAEDPEYLKENRERARKGMARLRKEGHSKYKVATVTRRKKS